MAIEEWNKVASHESLCFSRYELIIIMKKYFKTRIFDMNTELFKNILKLIIIIQPFFDSKLPVLLYKPGLKAWGFIFKVFLSTFLIIRLYRNIEYLSYRTILIKG